ncbi:MAG: hypothetical protein IRZ07_25990 [Microbispora sp.]|nr:hypothetical protein [Microbispora sp.]
MLSETTSAYETTGRGRVLSNVTRYLCAGAYLDSRFRDAVLDELLDDPYRAVAPSYGGVDLRPVLLHCLRARRHVIGRDVIITVLLAAGVLISFPTVGSTYLALLPVALLTIRRLRSAPVTRTLLIAWCLLNLVGWFLIGFLQGVMTALSSRPPAGAPDLPEVYDVLGQAAAAWFFMVAPFVVTIGYRIFWYSTLAVTLRPGVRHVDPPVPADVASRLRYVDQAQWGNLTLYGTEDPFLGAGGVRRSWSIVVELDRPKSSGDGQVGKGRRKATIDPVALHEHIRRRLTEMRDDVVTPQESIKRLHISHHLAARGTFRRLDWSDGAPDRPWQHQSHPLIDPGTGLPRFDIPAELLETIIRNPQAGLRYYQRVTVGAESPELAAPTGGVIVPGEDQEVTVSAFIYLAVEGRLLYTQFVVTALPPCRREYHVVDTLPTLSGVQIAWQAVRALRPSLLADVLCAPFRLIGALDLRRQFRDGDPRRSLVYPFGATRSVRELGAEPEATTFIQRLDIDKYAKLIERRLTEGVLDFLEAHDIDTAAYRQQAAALHNYGVMISGGDVSGPIAAGTDAQAVSIQQHS